MANVTGSFTATGQSGSFKPIAAGRSTINAFNVCFSGNGVGSVQLEKSFDETTWYEVWAGGSQLYAWTLDGTTNFCEQTEETEQGVYYRLNCTSYTSGTITYRISQASQF